MDGWLALSIRRNDRGAECDWRIFQRIKNELAGPEREAVQLFPAMSRCVDTSNQYYLWVAPKGSVIGLGYQDQLIVAHDARFRPANTAQRPFDADCPIGELAASTLQDREFDPVFPLPLYPSESVRIWKESARKPHEKPKESDDGNDRD